MINNFEIHIDFDRLESNLPKFECEFNFEGVKVYTTKKQAGKALNKQLEENKTLAA